MGRANKSLNASQRKIIQDDSATHFTTYQTKYNPHYGLITVFKLLMSQHLSKPQVMDFFLKQQPEFLLYTISDSLIPIPTATPAT
jgi:homoserine acetyltransferase